MNMIAAIHIQRLVMSGVVLSALLAGCTARHIAATGSVMNQTDRSAATRSETHLKATAMPYAVAFRMNGRYDGNVPVSLDSDGRVLSYPSPTDITEQSRPLALADGWWLDRRGVGSATAFTRYTYEEYAALPQPPSVEELKAAVIAGARITELVKLPMTLSEAQADTVAVNAFLRASSPQLRRP